MLSRPAEDGGHDHRETNLLGANANVPSNSSTEGIDLGEPTPHERLLPGPSGASDATMAPQSRPPRRTLTFVDGLAIVVGVQIGSGIFTSPAAVLADVHTPIAALLVWVAAGGLAWTGAASFITLGRAVPRNGGIQEYLRYCYNDAAACVATWALVLIVKPASIAMVTLIFAEYLLGALAPGSAPAPGVSVGGAWAAKGLAVLALLAFTLLNCVGTRVSARIANFFLVLKLFGLGLVVVTGLTLGPAKGKGSAGPEQAEVPPEDGLQKGSHWANAGIYTDAVLTAMWAYSGWESVCAFFMRVISIFQLTLSARLYWRRTRVPVTNYISSSQQRDDHCDNALCPGNCGIHGCLASRATQGHRHHRIGLKPQATH